MQCTLTEDHAGLLLQPVAVLWLRKKHAEQY
jgi:hypothetical protein